MTSDSSNFNGRWTADQQAAADLRLLDREVEARRLQIFRTCLARRVCLASPLLLDACEPRKLDEALWRVHPAFDWPDRPEVDIVIRGQSKRRHSKSDRETSCTQLEGKTEGVVMDHVALRISGRSAHMIMRFGGIAIHTTDLGGRLIAPPLASSSEGRDLVGASLDRVLKHPIVIGKEYWILSAEPTLSGRVTILEFKAAPAEWRVPWARPWEPIF